MHLAGGSHNILAYRTCSWHLDCHNHIKSQAPVGSVVAICIPRTKQVSQPLSPPLNSVLPTTRADSHAYINPILTPRRCNPTHHPSWHLPRVRRPRTTALTTVDATFSILSWHPEEPRDPDPPFTYSWARMPLSFDTEDMKGKGFSVFIMYANSILTLSRRADGSSNHADVDNSNPQESSTSYGESARRRRADGRRPGAV